MTDVKEILSHIDYLMSNHDSSLDYEAALEDVRSFILEREKGDHIVYKHGMVEPAEEYAHEKEKEPIDGDIEKAVDEYLSTYFGSEQEKQNWPFLKKMAIHFAEWQQEQMMAKAADAMICLPYENKYGGYTHLIHVSRPLPVGKNKIAIIFKED